MTGQQLANTTRSGSAALFLSDSGAERRDLEALLRGLGFGAIHIDGADAISRLREPVAIWLLDLRGNGEAIRTARAIRAQNQQAVVIGIADPARPAAATEAIRAGVFDVLPRPPSARDLEALIANAHEQAALAATPSAAASREPFTFGIVGNSPAMRQVLELVRRAASGRCGITICGERGCGREMVARAIHAYGPNPQAPFVKIDCSGPTPEDIELQLFGSVTKRSVPAAAERRNLERVARTGLLFESSGGVLFLENVADLPARVQARLVRILRDREALVDDHAEPVTLDIRPIASADSTLPNGIEEGLRPDLHERLSLIRFDLPALRQRREDIPVLASHFLKELCKENNTPIKTLTRSALTLLSALPWRGNAPELRGLLERLILLVPGGLIRLEDVLAHTQLEGNLSPTGVDATLRQARARFERDYIAAVLQHHHGRIADAARVLGIQRTNLYRKMRRLNLMRPKAASREW